MSEDYSEDQFYEDDLVYYEVRTQFSDLEKAVMRYSLAETLSGKVDERDIIYSKREINVFIKFIDFICTDARDIIPILFEDQEKQETLVSATLDLQYYVHKGITFMMSFVREEFANAKSETELFMENSIANIISKCFFMKVGKSYMKRYFGKWFNQFLLEKNDFEIDQYKITDEKTIKRNLDNLNKKAREVLQIIYSTIDQTPHGVKIAAKMHSELIKEYFPQLSEHAKLNLTSQFIVNQLYIQALLYPEKYGLCTHDQISIKNRRNLRYISKILQTLVLKTEFQGKGADYMSQMNEILKQHTQTLNDRLINLIVSSQGFPYSMLLDDNLTISKENLSVLHMELCNKSSEIIRLFPEEISTKFCEFMIEIGEHKDKLDFLFDFTYEQQELIRKFLHDKDIEGVYIGKIDVTDHEYVGEKKKKKKDIVISAYIIVSLYHVWFIDSNGEVITSLHCLSLKSVEMAYDDQIIFRNMRGEKEELIKGNTARGNEIIVSMIRSFKSSFANEKVTFDIKLSEKLNEKQKEQTMKNFKNTFALRKFTKCGGFTGIYEAQCTFRDYHINSSIKQSIENSKPSDKESHHLKVSKFYNGDLNSREDHLTAHDLIPIFFTLKPNMYFTKITVENMNLIKCFDGLKEYLKENHVIKSLTLRNIDIGRGWEELFQNYIDNKRHPLRKLDISNNVLDEKAVSYISKLVLDHKLETLYIANVLTSEKISSALLESLKTVSHEKKRLRKIDISGSKLTPASINIISQNFSTLFPRLEKIFLRDINVPKDKSVLGFLQNMKHLKLLDLSGMKLSLKYVDETSKHLQDYIGNCEKMTDIILNRVLMPGDVLKVIIKSIKNDKLRVDLKQSELPIAIMKEFSPVFMGLETVQHVDISDCGIGEEGLCLLLESLCQNTIIQSINLSYNLFNQGNKENIVKALVKLISGGTGLKCLKIAGGMKQNQQLGTSIVSIFDALATNRTIREFDCSNHMFGNKGAFALANLLTVNDTLQVINWDGNNIMINGLRAITEALRINTTLKEFKFPISDCGKIEDVEEVRSLLSSMVNSLNRTEEETQN